MLKLKASVVVTSVIVLLSLIMLFALPSTTNDPTIDIEITDNEVEVVTCTDNKTTVENTTIIETEVVESIIDTSVFSTTTTETEVVTTTKTSVNSKNLGVFKITVYTPYCDNGDWGYQTATGVKSKHLSTCAVDPKVIPLGSEIVVNGLKLKAVDVGGAVKGNVIDIFYDGTKEEATEWVSEFGTKHNVYIF